MDLTATPEWQALAAHYDKISTTHLRELFADDPERGDRMTAGAADLVVDYSKQRANDETFAGTLRTDIEGKIMPAMRRFPSK